MLSSGSFRYDSNGNLTGDGTRNFSYDDENELVSACVSNSWSNSFAYDGKMRRRIERDYTWSAGWVETNEVHFIYDGNVVVQERDANNVPQVTYTLGLDLSHTWQDAGGIGGLLARTENPRLSIAGQFGTAFYHSDGNGNVTYLMYSNGLQAAKYLYDAFGNTLAMSGFLANANKYRFSSKEWNANAGIYYYLYRFYDPNLQRWLNRDPLTEVGFLIHILLSDPIRPLTFAIIASVEGNLYDYVNNDVGNDFDVDGLAAAASQPIPCNSPPPDPCPGFQSQWPGSLQKVGPKLPYPVLPNKITCIGANTSCLQDCAATYGPGADYQDDKSPPPACYKECNADCYSNFRKCMGKK